MVRELCQKHLPSLSAFKFPSGSSFAIFANEEPMTGDLRHLTTTATCIESLRDCHATCISKSALVNIANTVGIEEQEFSKLTAAQAMQLLISSLVTSYYAGATKRPLDDWVSEKSAPIYCIARSMPLFLD